VVAGKPGLQIFLPKKPIFQPISITKHLTNTKKPTYQPIKPKKQLKPLNQTRKNIASLT
jgi:hypothetical protein